MAISVGHCDEDAMNLSAKDRRAEDRLVIAHEDEIGPARFRQGGDVAGDIAGDERDRLDVDLLSLCLIEQGRKRGVFAGGGFNIEPAAIRFVIRRTAEMQRQHPAILITEQITGELGQRRSTFGQSDGNQDREAWLRLGGTFSASNSRGG